MEFLQQHGLTLAYNTCYKSTTYDSYQSKVQPAVDELRKVKTKVCAVSIVTESMEDTIDDYAVPTYHTYW